MPKAKKVQQEETISGMETHRFDAEVGKVLHLMIHSLYTNKDIFLRELISNASDACDKLRYAAQQDGDLLKDDPALRIAVSVDKDARQVTVCDNGIGMNHDDLVQHLGTIAKSGTQEFLHNLSGDKARDVELIGQFGVGFYSAFIVADKVTVDSRRAGESEAWRWQSDGEGSYTVEPLPDGHPRGTTITLQLREGEDDYLDRFRLHHIIKTYSDHVAIPIYYHDGEEAEHQVNSGSALWTRPKSEISEEQYREFYRNLAHSSDEPWLTLHTQAEGTVSYTSLLYVPSHRPFDLFHPDRMRRVKLYIRRVFITEEGVDLIPHWLRFLRGVIDSEDLPLNISRETLQHNRILEKIRKAVTSKVLGELKKRAEKDANDYATFWKHFGPALKEGLCEPGEHRESLLEICRFHSSKNPESLVGLDEYIARMPEGQEAIYYLTGEDVDILMHSPQLEGFLSRGWEVLLLTDHVDSFWTTLVQEYKGKKLESVTRAVLPELAAGQDDSGAADGKDASPAADDADIAVLIAAMKTVLGEEVKDIRTTQKLTKTPVCLAVGEGDMDIRMERFLVESKQLPAMSTRILEINPRHPVIAVLAQRVKAEGADAASDPIWLLLDQARVAEGEALKDPAAFSQRLSALMQRAL